MAVIASERRPEVAKVDKLIDENGAPLEVAPETAIVATGKAEDAVGGTGPTAWWRVGLIGIAIVAAMLLGLQLLSGGANTDMVPGTPTTVQNP
jgi:hypothetical protein